MAVTPDGKQLLVGVGKGNQTKPNPIRQAASDREGTDLRQADRLPFPYIGTTLSGALSIVPVPDDEAIGRVHRDRFTRTAPIRTSC